MTGAGGEGTCPVTGQGGGSGPIVGIVGATGAVGTTMLRLLRDRRFPAAEVVPLASARSAGKVLDGGLKVEELADRNIGGIDIAIFSAGGSISREWAPKFVEKGAIVIDNSSAFRADPEVPLVVSEVNGDLVAQTPKGIIANPNCTTMAFMPPMKALHDVYGLRSLVASSYQAVGGAGQKGMDELAEQIPTMLGQREKLVDAGAEAYASVTASVHAKPIAFNVVPWLGSEKEGGYTDEELKMLSESRKILDLPELTVAPTCVRVPVMVGHAIAIRATFAREVDVDEAKAALAAMPGVALDDVPTPLEWAGRDEVVVGRIRKDLADPCSLNLFVVGDNLLKGAALNTIQIAELLVEKGLVRT
ncbi:aspartate-semialdehyde dehydrogenase [Conexibacter sp. W3-3-2]|uniref:aspartate-semialdehyde dehydrogenase n=1 Tax=Conexibacter sp. W3-3-2 TaxID=2675227 RepID=UPI0012B8A678|nr:aspartate-semialdehyde dehydrogenase [Conexibacter sp. W3-3-2]MTD44506.1 aspartate-semialdehyde dehydrogenase [Conexibacter sp. W3-3-2]